MPHLILRTEKIKQHSCVPPERRLVWTVHKPLLSDKFSKLEMGARHGAP